MQKYKKLLGSRMNPKRPTPKHTIEKLSKTKDMNLENSKRKLFYSLQGTASVRLSVDFSAQTLQVRRLSNNIFKVLIKKTLSTENTVSSKTVLQKRERN